MSMPERHIGPNMRRFIAHKSALIMIPPGCKDPLSVVDVILSKDGIAKAAREATAWCFAAVDAVKAAPDNPHGDDDEVIAGVILAGIDARKAEQGKAHIARARFASETGRSVEEWLKMWRLGGRDRTEPTDPLYVRALALEAQTRKAGL